MRTSGVRDNGADDTSDVTRGERDAELSALAVRVLGLGEHLAVEHLNNLRGKETGEEVRVLTYTQLH